MLSCWELEGSKRPKFSYLVVTVNDLLERDAGYLELSLCHTNRMSATATPPHSSATPEIELIELATSEPEVNERDVDVSTQV